MNTPRSTLLGCLALLGGCSAAEVESFDVGELRACLGSSALPPEGAPVPGGGLRWDVQGVVTAIGPFDEPPGTSVIPCARGLGKAFELEDAEGVTWRVGLALVQQDVDATPDLPVTTGQAVSVSVLNADVQGELDTSVVVRDGGGLVLAAERGLGGVRLQVHAPELIPGVSVERGRTVGLFLQRTCGFVRATALEVTDDDGPVEVLPWEPTEVTVGGQPMLALNPGTWTHVDEPTCGLSVSPLSWVLTLPRDPPAR